jgi:hypothetical protein
MEGKPLLLTRLWLGRRELQLLPLLQHRRFVLLQQLQRKFQENHRGRAAWLTHVQGSTYYNDGKGSSSYNSGK